MSILDITPQTDLQPKKKFFAEVGDECLNVDACILLCKQTDTPQARAIYRSYRKRMATNGCAPGLTAEKIRENAFFDGLHDLGIRTPMTKISGDMT